MPLVEFRCDNDQCNNKDVIVEKLVSRVYESEEEAASDAPVCSLCGLKTVWKDVPSRTGFKINFAPFH